jgi:hypothetical protein
MKSKSTACLLLVSMFSTSIISGCATASKDISAVYVSPVQYANYDCNQIVAELQRIHGRVSQVGGRLDAAATNDKLIMGAGLLLFWPALFAVGGTKTQEQEYARLKGEYDAVTQTGISKKCNLALAVPTPPTDPAGAVASDNTPK